MINLSLSTIATAIKGRLICHESLREMEINNLVTDSRALIQKSNSQQEITKQEETTNAFLALKGPNFDGHRFVQQVIEKGCQVVIVEQQITEIESNKVAQIIVDDSRIALGQIASYVKQQIALKTVGITGSSGKTTVKEMLAAILSRLGKVLATEGNFNNDIGVPLTLLRLEPEHDFAVIEMGANHIGEIAYTSDLVKPDVAVINNIAAAHLEGFGDLCGVARAKGEIFAGLSQQGMALYNIDTKYASKWLWRLTDKQVRTFSCANARFTDTPTNADCYSENIVLDENGCAQFDMRTSLGQCDIKLTIPGVHNVCNAVAAAAAAIECGASLQDIQLGLAQMSPVKGRLNIYHLKGTSLSGDIKLIDDTYNANVESIKAAIALLAGYKGQRILVLGDMAELGSDARSYHQEVGEYAKEQGIEVLLTLGVLSQNTSDAFARENEAFSEHFNDKNMLEARLLSILTTENKQVQPQHILIKGSRSAHMEYVVEDIIDWHEKQQTKDQNSNSFDTNKQGIA